MNPDTAPLYCLLAMWVTLVWFSVLNYLDMLKLSRRLDDVAVRTDGCASKAQFEYTNARVTHLTNHLKTTGVLKAFVAPKHSAKKSKR